MNAGDDPISVVLCHPRSSVHERSNQAWGHSRGGRRGTWWGRRRCLDRPIYPGNPDTNTQVAIQVPNQVINKIDMLFDIDNSVDG